MADWRLEEGVGSGAEFEDGTEAGVELEGKR